MPGADGVWRGLLDRRRPRVVAGRMLGRAPRNCVDSGEEAGNAQAHRGVAPAAGRDRCVGKCLQSGSYARQPSEPPAAHMQPRVTVVILSLAERSTL